MKKQLKLNIYKTKTIASSPMANRKANREGNGTPLQYSCLETPMDGEHGRLQSMGLLRVGHD